MRPTLRFLGWVACLVLCLALPALAVGGVYDNAHMFSAGTIGQLNSQIMAMRGSYNKDVYVITSPGGEGSWQSVAQRYTGGPNIDGVVIFIDQGAHKTYVAEDHRTEEVINKDVLKGAINGPFKQRNFDGGILAGTAYLQNTFASHSPARGMAPAPAYAPRPITQPRNSGGGAGLFFLLFLIVGVLILVGIVRAIFRGVTGVAGSVMGGNVGPGYGPQYGPGYGPQYGPPAQGGGGFGSSFLGGAGGAIAGNALYDHFERRGGNEGYMPPAAPGGGFVNAPSQPDWQQPGTSSDWSDTGSSSGGGGSDSSSWSGDSGSSWGGDSGSGGGGGGSDWS